MAQKRAGWHQQDIIAAIRKNGSSISRLSIEQGFHRGTLHGALYKRSPGLNAIIADFIGVSRHELWPHWFGPDDQPLPLSHHPVRQSRRAA